MIKPRILILLFVSIVTVPISGCGARTGSQTVAAHTGTPASNSNLQLITLSDTEQAPAADTVNFGRVGSGEIVLKPLRLLNEGAGPVVIVDVDKTCGCVDLDYPRRPLKSGEAADVEMEFDSRGLKGWVYKTLIIKISSAQDASLIQKQVVVTAEVE
ncbi:MAG: DUF1573 domain-containing protein [Alistipes sp.]|nr:DUF1573 domain-containing protein [Alistipes sp.]